MSEQSAPEPYIRLFRSGDEPSLSKICCATGNKGEDATGLLSNDEIWGDVYVLPYVARDPSLAWVVEAGGAVVGYCVATDDTQKFNEWFGEEWWPKRQSRFTRDQTPRETTIFDYADAKTRATPDPYGYNTRYPAHMHIDLLPSAQGRGIGAKLITTAISALRERKVSAVRLGTSAENVRACRFYTKLGFGEADAKAGSRVFVLDLQEQ
ncbi:hypothetical protein CI109_106708 [Kwoniella shandongensis]|uniref:Uncharacterized protein n=1 Tax=Kwoniella shandongensis TaxID=1734106 RepID=A0A5M6CBP9_9TREE|nr:uncharacterized protein CI109_001035 [Kwoniella shandongensis]KAA5530855.1 hypothetical protein CI109_001035 [Kwoniella shandongensis]